MAPTAAPITSSAQALSALNNYQSGMKTPEQTITDAQTTAGIPQQQQQVTGLRGAIQNTQNLISQVAPSVMGRTANSLVTSAQADQQITNAETPLNTQLNTENTAYGDANDDLNTATNSANSKAEAELTAQNSQLAAYQDLYKTLSGNEQNAAQAAEAEREFNATLAEDQAKASSAASSAASPTFGSTTPATVGKVSQNSAGGYAVTDASGKPITLGQYVNLNGGTMTDLVNLLNNSGSASDHSIAAAISSGKYTTAQLKQMYPQALGG